MVVGAAPPSVGKVMSSSNIGTGAKLMLQECFVVCVTLVSDHPLISEAFATFLKESIRRFIIIGRYLWEGSFLSATEGGP